METETRETNNNYYPEGMGPFGWMRQGAPATGVVGTALGGFAAVVGTAALVWAAMKGQNGNNGGCSGDKPVTRYELGLVQENNALRAEKAKLESQIYTDAKFEAVNTTVGALNMAQQRINDNVQAMITQLASQAQTFAGLTQVILSPRAIAPAEAIMKALPAPASTTTAASTATAGANG